MVNNLDFVQNITLSKVVQGLSCIFIVIFLTVYLLA